MAEYHPPVRPDYTYEPSSPRTRSPRPHWAQSQYQRAQDLLESSDEPIEYDHDDRDYWDNCFFFPEDCSWSPPTGWRIDKSRPLTAAAATMIPGLPDIKMLDADALSDLLEDNLSPPEITSILVFATNGAIFAYASPLPTRQLRNLSATYGAAYTCYAKSASTGNLTGVNPASHPSSYVTAQSVSLGDVGSIVFELDDLVAVVTRIADKVLLAAVGPSKPTTTTTTTTAPATTTTGGGSGSDSEPADGEQTTQPRGSSTATPTPANGTPQSVSRLQSDTALQTDAQLETQYQIDRSSDLERLASLNLSASPAILLALESKSAALGRFLSQKLDDLESPEDF
ncbi:hypothetical protein BDV59DRAFT_40276 [Aspergillus ambiguus]|uniref:uncharacterized protein n=1 Tax=Aspergillus ambiguus TaxID=176160 RepID=UPI003CCD8190